MRIYDIIKQKRDGQKLSREQIQYFVEGYTAGEIKDYQASALLMAIFLNGFDKQETIELTEAMMNSGDVVDLSNIKGVKVDKHSTGGVGDTTTMVLAPLVASLGVPIAKMSGRGLGHTGGTIDKLESIPGFHVELSPARFADNVNRHGIAVIGQSKNIAPADKKLYALRDVTATVENISLIASSIMSKKLAAGSNGIVLDVKTGSGAFIKSVDESIQLAQAMVDIGNGMKRQTIGVITDMSQPLGMAIGNSLEVIEAIETLKGQGPSDLTELCLALGAQMAVIGGVADDVDNARQMLQDNIDNGRALDKLREFIAAQDGDDSVVEDYGRLPQAVFQHRVEAAVSGYLKSFKNEQVGVCAMLLGAGRRDMSSQIDLSAGIQLAVKIGDRVAKGDLIATLHTNDQAAIAAVERQLLASLEISQQPCAAPTLVKAIVSGSGVKKF